MKQRSAIPWGVACLTILAFAVVSIQRGAPRVVPLPVPVERILETVPPSESNPGKDAVVSMGAAAVPSLVRTLQSRQWYESRVLQHLRRRFPRVLREWVRQADDADHGRRVAAWLLGELGPSAEAAVPALRLLAEKPGPDDLHGLIILALARIEPSNRTAFSNAAALLSSSKQTCRYHAANHLGALTNHPAMDPSILIPALSDTDEWVRGNAASSLAEFGVRARDAAPRLRELLDDPQPHVATHAAYALALVSPVDRPIAAVAVAGRIVKGEPVSEHILRFFGKPARGQ